MLKQSKLLNKNSPFQTGLANIMLNSKVNVRSIENMETFKDNINIKSQGYLTLNNGKPFKLKAGFWEDIVDEIKENLNVNQINSNGMTEKIDINMFKKLGDIKIFKNIKTISTKEGLIHSFDIGNIKNCILVEKTKENYTLELIMPICIKIGRNDLKDKTFELYFCRGRNITEGSQVGTYIDPNYLLNKHSLAIYMLNRDLFYRLALTTYNIYNRGANNAEYKEVNKKDYEKFVKNVKIFIKNGSIFWNYQLEDIGDGLKGGTFCGGIKMPSLDNSDFGNIQNIEGDYILLSLEYPNNISNASRNNMTSLTLLSENINNSIGILNILGKSLIFTNKQISSIMSFWSKKESNKIKLFGIGLSKEIKSSKKDIIEISIEGNLMNHKLIPYNIESSMFIQLIGMKYDEKSSNIGLISYDFNGDMDGLTNFIFKNKGGYVSSTISGFSNLPVKQISVKIDIIDQVNNKTNSFTISDVKAGTLEEHDYFNFNYISELKTLNWGNIVVLGKSRNILKGIDLSDNSDNYRVVIYNRFKNKIIEKDVCDYVTNKGKLYVLSKKIEDGENNYNVYALNLDKDIAYNELILSMNVSLSEKEADIGYLRKDGEKCIFEGFEKNEKNDNGINNQDNDKNNDQNDKNNDENNKNIMFNLIIDDNINYSIDHKVLDKPYEITNVLKYGKDDAFLLLQVKSYVENKNGYLIIKNGIIQENDNLVNYNNGFISSDALIKYIGGDKGFSIDY